MNKWWAPKLAFDVVKQCMLAHGHTGWGEDLNFLHYLSKLQADLGAIALGQLEHDAVSTASASEP